MLSRSYMTCGLKIDTKSEGWHKCLTKMLKNIQGSSYSVDAEGGMAYVSGKVNPNKLLKRLMKAGKEAEICWVMTGDQYTYGNENGYYEDQSYDGGPYHRGSDPNYNMDGYYGHYRYYSYGYHEPPMTHYYPLQAPYTYYH